jgi:putative transposase
VSHCAITPLTVIALTWARGIGPVDVRASSTLLNGSEELGYEEPQAYAGADRAQAQGGRPAARGGVRAAGVLKELEISEATYHRWRAQYGGMKADDVKRLKELESENQKLKRIVADQALDIQGLKELSAGNF